MITVNTVALIFDDVCARHVHIIEWILYQVLHS